MNECAFRHRVVHLCVLLLPVFVLPVQGQAPRLRYVATARQFGPVGFRDPLGVLSPDGAWLAHAATARLYVQPVAGGAMTPLGPGTDTVTEMVWLPDSRRLAVRERSPDRSTARWVVYDRITGARTPLWPDGLRGRLADGTAVEAPAGALRYLTRAPDGRLAGIVPGDDSSQVWVLPPGDGEARVRQVPGQRSHPAWTPGGDGPACLVMAAGRLFLDETCAAPPAPGVMPEAYGPPAFSPDGAFLYYAAPNEHGTLDLWRRRRDGTAEVLTRFTRDTYAPSVDRAGGVLFKTQDYRTVLALVPATGGPTRPLTTFQSETPSWDRQGQRLAFTYGSWRRVTDDLHYPDIAQDIGLIHVDPDHPAAAPAAVVRASHSEDQGMDWSPDGRWIVFHTHADGTDDLRLQPADGSAPPRVLTRGGHETGWPRWSPDGRWIVAPTMRLDGGARHGVLWLLGIDQETGAVTAAPEAIPLDGFAGEAGHAEWLPDSRGLVFEAIVAPGRNGLFEVSRTGGTPRLIHAFHSDQTYSGIGLSPDGRWVAFIAPAPDGHFQVFRIPRTGGAPEQLTFDPTDKTQPAYAPDGERIAFTVFSYQAHFWLLTP